MKQLACWAGIFRGFRLIRDKKYQTAAGGRVKARQ